MRFPTRFNLGLLATALAAPLTGSATAQQMDGYTPSAPITLDHAPSAAGYRPVGAGSAPAASAPHNHKGLLGWRHCTECQRARAKAESGIDVPPPPSSMPQGQVVHQGHSHGHDHGQGQVVGSTGCAACEAGAVTITETDAFPAGHAVSNEMMSSSDMPAGHAVVGSDPAPVGISRSSQGNFTPFNAMAAGGPRQAQRDPSVMPTSTIPAQTAMGGHEAGRPRIISHLFGLPDLRRLRKETSSYKNREHHAAISYEEGVGPVTDIPASMVYGKKDH
jgi:hypothetical protein